MASGGWMQTSIPKTPRVNTPPNTPVVTANSQNTWRTWTSTGTNITIQPVPNGTIWTVPAAAAPKTPKPYWATLDPTFEDVIKEIALNRVGEVVSVDSGKTWASRAHIALLHDRVFGTWTISILPSGSWFTDQFTGSLPPHALRHPEQYGWAAGLQPPEPDWTDFVNLVKRIVDELIVFENGEQALQWIHRWLEGKLSHSWGSDAEFILPELAKFTAIIKGAM